MAQLVLARAHLEQGELERGRAAPRGSRRELRAHESVSHQARSWMTRGELELLRENDAEAARLYREAAVALQPPDACYARVATRSVSPIG